MYQIGMSGCLVWFGLGESKDGLGGGEEQREERGGSNVVYALSV